MTVIAASLPLGCAMPKSTPPGHAATGKGEPSTMTKVNAAVSGTTKKVVDSFKPKPKHAEPADPLSLSQKTKPAASHVVHVAQAKLYASGGNIAAAEIQYRKALEAAPTDLAALTGYARMLESQGRRSEATELYQRAGGAHPQLPAVHNDLGQCLVRRAMPERAIEAYARAVELAPERQLYRNNIAAALVQLGRDDEALAHLAAVHAPATARYNLGVLLHQCGRPDAAAQQFAATLRIEPDMEPARVWLSRLAPPNAVPHTTSSEAMQVADTPVADPYQGGAARREVRQIQNVAPLPPHRSDAFVHDDQRRYDPDYADVVDERIEDPVVRQAVLPQQPVVIRLPEDNASRQSDADDRAAPLPR
jgi:tetratricopeptide (TPR) repeat protein